jgi:hypothetical protein
MTKNFFIEGWNNYINFCRGSTVIANLATDMQKELTNGRYFREEYNKLKLKLNSRHILKNS